jgi:ATP-dependent Clp protease ATP-binding subunit ClpC
MYERFSDRARKVMQLAVQEAQRFNHEYIGTEHILLGLLQEGSGVAANVLKNLDVDPRTVRMEIEKIVQSGPDMVTMSKLPQTPRAKKVIEYAIEEARNFNHDHIGTEHLLLGLVREQEGIAAQVLMNLGVKLEDVREEVLNLLGPGAATTSGSSTSQPADQSKPKTPTLDSFGRDLTEAALRGWLGPVIGRMTEIERVLEVLCRRDRDNPVLLGESGVGKAAIVEGLAQCVVAGSVPKAARERRIVALDMLPLALGPEDVVRTLAGEVSRAPDVLLFLDNLHLEDAHTPLRPLLQALAGGKIQYIAAISEVRDLARLHHLVGGESCEVIPVRPPSREETIEILRGRRDRYEAHHRVHITDEALDSAVELSDRYVLGRCLPGKALDVLDKACVRVHSRTLTRPPDLTAIDAQIQQLTKDKEAAVAEQDFDKAANLRDQADRLKKQKEAITQQWQQTSQEVEGVVDRGVVREVVGELTGLRLARIDRQESIRLLTMEDELNQTVIGQPDAVAAIARALRRSRAGLTDPRRPIGTFLCVGPTGVGKTHLAGQLARFLFGDDNALVQIDLSALSAPQSARRLRRRLDARIARLPGGFPGVILLEGFELAHPEVRELLLEVLDFRSPILLVTTSIGAERSLPQGFGLGRSRRSDEGVSAEMKAKLRQEMEKVFGLQLVNRFDDILVFGNLTRDSLKPILDLMLSEVSKRLEEQDLKLVVSDEAREFLIDKGTRLEHGAWPLHRAIEQFLEDPLAEELLRGRFAGKDTVTVRTEEVGGEKKLLLDAGNREGE